jgi:predicted permease
VDTLLQDLRFGFRLLLKKPLFTTIAILVLALGIGVNSAMFSLVNALLFKPLAVEAPGDLIGVYDREAKPDGSYRAFSYPNYLDLRLQNDTFTHLMAFTTVLTGITEGDTTRRTFAAAVTANYFTSFGVQPILGRDFLPQEEQPESAIPVAIVSHAFWRKHGLDPGILGQHVIVNGRSFEIIGVAPRFFTGTAALFSPELWVPLGVHAWVVNDFTGRNGKTLTDRSYHCLHLVGRLKPGLIPAQAQARLRPLAQRLAETDPAENKDRSIELAQMSRFSISTNPSHHNPGATLAALLLPMSAVVLLIACLNLANMLLARGAARRKEIAVRLALGGGRWRIVRQLLTEGLLLSLLGGAAGLLLASWITSLLASSLNTKIPFLTLVFQAGPDLRVLGATFGFCLLATLLFAFIPAWRLVRTDVIHDLKTSCGDDERPRRHAAALAPRNLLVVGQIALSLVLLTASGLFVRAAHRAAAADPGFRFEQGLLIEMDASLAGIDEAQGRALYRSVTDRVRTMPGVESVSTASMVPFGIYSDGRSVRPAGAGQANNQSADASLEPSQSPSDAKPIEAGYVIVGTDYFKTIGLPLLRGREFDRVEIEIETGHHVAIISEPLAQRLWPNDDALGRHIQLGENKADQEPVILQVVGIVPGLLRDLSEKEPAPCVYVPFGPNYQSWMNLHVRLATRDPAVEAPMLRSIRAELKSITPQLPILSATTLRQFHSDGLVMWFHRTGARLFMAFAGLALFLAVVGVYGVKAYLVAQRTREIGIRMALGASTRQVLWQILADGLRLTAAGLLVGLFLALAVGRALANHLYEISGSDPLTFLIALLLLGSAAMIACYLPARRATLVQPTVALRSE